MIEVRIKYTDQEQKHATSLGEMSLSEAREFFEFFHYEKVVQREEAWENWLKNPSPRGGLNRGFNFLPVIENDPQDNGRGGPVTYGFLHSTLQIPEEGGKPYLLMEYMETN